MARQSRSKRRSGVVTELKPRDEALLRALGRFRIARTSQIVRILFQGVRRDTAAERLRRLYDAGYLDVRSSERSEENLYALGAAGKTWLGEHGQVAGSIPRGGLGHHLDIVEAWVALSDAAHESPLWRLELFRSDWEIREHTGSSEPLLVPDALVQLGRRDGTREPLRFALEVDRGTERPPELRRKIQLYEQLRTGAEGLFGWKALGLIVAVDGSGLKRQSALSTILREEWGSWSLLWSEGRPAGELLGDLAGLPLEGPLAARGGMPLQVTEGQGGSS